jgi:hypothetical protein
MPISLRKPQQIPQFILRQPKNALLFPGDSVSNNICYKPA